MCAAGVRLTSMVARRACVLQVLTPAAPVAYSFSGCSWLLIYHFGAATALAEADLHHAKHGASFLGTSSGALAAAALACDVDMAVLKQFYFELLRDSHTRVLGPMGRMSRYVRGGIDRMLPANAHKLATGRLFVATTKVSTESGWPQCHGVLISEFPTRDCLLDVLMASCYIPLYYETATVLGGSLHIDGGVWNNQPLHGSATTVTITPALGGGTISPRRAANGDVDGGFQGVFRLFPPQNEDEVERIWREGLLAGRQWVQRQRQLHQHKQSEVGAA